MALGRSMLFVILVFLLEYRGLSGEGEPPGEPRRPLGMSKELYCEGCEAAIKEMDKNLSKNAIDNVMIRIVEAMDAVCSPRILTVYKWSPPKMTKACLHVIGTYDEDLEERLYEQYRKPGHPKMPIHEFVDHICYYWIKACVDVDRDYEPDESVDGPEGEGLESQGGMAGPMDPDGIRTMGDKGDGNESEYETTWETDNEAEEEETDVDSDGKEKIVPGTGRANRTKSGKKSDDGSDILKRKANDIIDSDDEGTRRKSGGDAKKKDEKKKKKKLLSDDDDDSDGDYEGTKKKTGGDAKVPIGDMKKKAEDGQKRKKLFVDDDDDSDDKYRNTKKKSDGDSKYRTEGGRKKIDEDDDDSDDADYKRRGRIPDAPDNTTWMDEEKKKRDDDDDNDEKKKKTKNARNKDEL